MSDCITMTHVSKSFQGHQALVDLTVNIKEGEIFGFLGPSGAGKTTTIKLLSGQLTWEAGQITVLGQSVEKSRETLYQNIGILSDNSSFYEKLSVYDNLKIFAQIYQIPESKIMETLTKLGLEKDVKKKAGTLSRGMKQRLMFARAILHSPKLLFLDEPTANLDPFTSEEVHQLIVGLNRQGTTVFLTTHNMEEADELCDRVAFLNQGKIVELGAPEELKLKYSSGLVNVLLANGETCQIERTRAAMLNLLNEQKQEILRIHSVEPDLKTIFLDLTGRELI